MAYPKIIQQGLLDWIAGRISNGEPTPTDQEIISRFGMSGAEAARSLLADLADGGKITIKGFGANRIITLGQTKTAFIPSRPISRSALQPRAPVEDRVAMMRRVLADKKPDVQPPVAPAPSRPEKTLIAAPPAPSPRLIIPAPLAAAAIRDGFAVIDFAHRMMLLGLAAYAHEMTPEPEA